MFGIEPRYEKVVKTFAIRLFDFYVILFEMNESIWNCHALKRYCCELDKWYSGILIIAYVSNGVDCAY